MLDYFLHPTSLRVVASLDMPAVASGRDFSIWCRKPIRRRGDNLLATEHSYVDRDFPGLSNPRFLGELVTDEYRPDIDKVLPTGFFESIDLARPADQYFYLYQLTDPKRSRAIRKLRRLLKKNDDEIRKAFGVASGAAVTLASAAAGPAGVPLGVIGALAQPVGQMVFDALLAHLGKALEDTSMTQWSIAHTILYMPEYPIGPLSMFILLSPAAHAAKLHRVRRDDIDYDVSVMDLDYQHTIRAQQRGRGMMGLSQPQGHPCPADLWAQVADANQPAAWTEPGQDRRGFRVLVPHAEAGAEASYVSALRADVFDVSQRGRSYQI
jgi:hypothetical protein